jgi:Multidrug resistance efflux pump
MSTQDRPNLYDRPIFAQGPSRPPRPRSAPPRPRRRMSLNLKLFLFLIVMLSAMAATAYFALRPEEDVYTLDTFQYTSVGVRDFRNVVQSSGRFVPSRIVVLTAPGEATALSTLASPGDDVQAGALLALLDSEGLRSELAAARVELEIATIEVDQARLEHQQEVARAEDQVEAAEEALAQAEARIPVMEELLALGGISQSELEEARAAARNARIELLRARERLVAAERQAELAVKKAEQKVTSMQVKVAELERLVSELQVVAPIDARVLEVQVEPGERLEQGSVLFRLADIKSQYVETSVTPEQARELRVGAPALIRTSSAEYPARVEQVSPVAQAASSGAEVPVRLSVEPEVSALFLPYAPVSVEIELGELKERPYLVRGPFFSSGNASFVYLLSPDHTQAARREVRFGAIDGQYVEILSGLEPGDEVIYSSYLAFRSYPQIRVIPEGGRPVE